MRTTETKTCTDCHVSAQRRQQRDHGAAADARHQLRQLHRPVRLGRHRRGRRRGGRRDRVRRAAGGDRQRPAQAGLSGAVTPRTRSAGGKLTTSIHHGVDERARRAGARRVPLHRRRRGRLPGLRHRADRPQGLLRADRHRAGVAARPGHERQDAVRDGRGRAVARSRSIRRGRSCRRTRSSRSIRCTATSTSPIAKKGWCMSTAATLLDGNPSNNFLKRAATFNPDGRLRGARQPRDRRQLRLHPVRPRPGRRRHQRPDEAVDRRRKSPRPHQQAAPRSRCSSATRSSPTPTASRSSTSRCPDRRGS